MHSQPGREGHERERGTNEGSRNDSGLFGLASLWPYCGLAVAYLWLGLTVEIVTYKMVSREGI